MNNRITVAQVHVSVPLVLAVAALLAMAVVACKDSNTITEPPHVTVPPTPTAAPARTATPTPTPGPAVKGDISGAWTGTFKVGSWFANRNCLGTGKAHARFERQGSQFTGPLDATSSGSCHVSGMFTGGFSLGNTIVGRLASPLFGVAGLEVRGKLTISPPPESTKQLSLSLDDITEGSIGTLYLTPAQ